MGSRLNQKSSLVRKRIEGHEFTSESGEEYEGSKFGGFSEYFRRKKIKLQNLDAEIRAQSIGKPQIFKGVVCHVNGYTQPSLNDLHTMVVQHGGGFIQYLDGKTMATHIIASNLTLKKKEEFKRYRVVKPAWIVSSIQAGTLLPWDNFRVIDEGVGQKILGFENGQVVSQANRIAQGYREQTGVSWYNNQPESERNVPPPLGHSATPRQTNDDDECPTPEEASYSERHAEQIKSAKLDRLTREETPSRRELSHMRTELEDSPPESPMMVAQVLTQEPKSETLDCISEGQSSREDRDGREGNLDLAANLLHSREGSQEPGFSHAVIRDSEALRSISPATLAGMTAEEHNALLLSDPRIRKSTVVNPDFLEQYYRESRLHHLSTWKADLKSQLQAIAATTSWSQKAKQKRQPGQRRYIMHVDFDSFFAAVSLKKHPHLKGKPVAVAHGGGSGSEIASCNYPAREFGISNGMWMKRAQTLCSDLKVLPYDFPAYEEASRGFYRAIMATGGLVQSVSIDEALVDISTICFQAGCQEGIARSEGAVDREQSKADELAQQLRAEVLAETGCAVSIGIGANVLQAKVALRKAKPAGQYQLKSEEVLNFIGSLDVQQLPGVAWSIGGKLEEIGIKLVKDIWNTSREKLIATLGPKTGEKIWDYARGIDKTEIGEQPVRKSVSAEVNWGVRFQNQEQVDEFLVGLCDELHKRLIKERLKGKQLTMKVMQRAANAPRDPPKHLGHGICDVFNKSVQLGVATNDASVIVKEAIVMIKALCTSPGELRGIGVQMQKLEPLKQRANGIELGNEPSQPKLQFKTSLCAKPTIETDAKAYPPQEDLIQDDVDMAERLRFSGKIGPSMAATPLDRSTTTIKTPLNVLGTQFVLPTQVDPSVLAELPVEIQARMIRRSASSLPWQNNARAPPKAVDPPSSVEPGKHAGSVQSIPTQSQIDPTILEALPEDIRKEILNYYGGPLQQNEKTEPPQAPRKTRMVPRTRQPVRRGRPRGSRVLESRPRSLGNDTHTLTQANFIAQPIVKELQDDVDDVQDADAELEELDAEVLAALPEDLRIEVLDQQRKARLRKQGGLNLSVPKRSGLSRRKKGYEQSEIMAKHVVLQRRDSKPTFTSKNLCDLQDLREAVTAWVKEFSDEGPYEEDTEALKGYLHNVVLKEHDMCKAVAVIKWLTWTIAESENLSATVKHAWQVALDAIKGSFQDAVAERGLMRVDVD